MMLIRLLSCLSTCLDSSSAVEWLRKPPEPASESLADPLRVVFSCRGWGLDQGFGVWGMGLDCGWDWGSLPVSIGVGDQIRGLGFGVWGWLAAGIGGHVRCETRKDEEEAEKPPFSWLS